MLPNKFASVFEISYLLYGKAGYIISCFMFTSLTFGLLIIYNLTVAENFSILVSNQLGVDPKWKKSEFSLDRDSEIWIRLVTSQTFYIICLTLMQIPFIFKRQLEQIEELAYFCTSVIILYICLLIVYFTNGEKAINDPE